MKFNMKYLIVIGLIILTIATVYPMTIETFADVDPLRSDENGEGEEVEAFISSVSTKDDSVFAM